MEILVIWVYSVMGFMDVRKYEDKINELKKVQIQLLFIIAIVAIINTILMFDRKEMWMFWAAVIMFGVYPLVSCRVVD